MSDFCFLCGNTGELMTGEKCECVKNNTYFKGFNTRVCTFIPEEYQSVEFDSLLLPDLSRGTYVSDMKKLYLDIINGDLKNSIMVVSPIKTGKTVLAYSAIQRLFSSGREVFPIYDIQELGQYMSDLDKGKSYKFKDWTEVTIDSLYTCRYLFVKVPPNGDNNANLIYQLIDRRYRKGNYTIVLSHVDWDKVDKFSNFTRVIGDGSFGTLEYKSYK